MSRCVMVLGLMRSGTSAVAGTLHALGVDMGAGHLQPADESNPAGYYEDLRWQKVNKLVLGLRYSHSDPGKSHPKQGRYQQLARECQRADLWGMKDPRLCWTAQLIWPFLEECRVVVVQRQRGAVVASLIRHSEVAYHGEERLSRDQAGRMVEEYQAALERRVREFRGAMLFLRYERLVQFPEQEVPRIADFSFDGTGIEPDLGAGLGVIDRGLRHWA